MEIILMSINKYIDHTLLKPESTQDQIDHLIAEAKEYNFASVCVNPTWVSYAAQALKDSDVKVCTVIGFPLGANTSRVKAFETKDAIENGADEIDMVINIGQLKAKQYDLVENDIRAVVEASGDKLVKVIIETCLLTDEEKVKACELSVAAGADYVKTSTGFSTAGANVHDVALMRKTVGPNVGVKAAGGARTYADAEAFVKAGATRIGASSGVAIVNGETAAEGSY
ncbi:deoxyribose-phosphate aldolase [Streptococcus equinus]|uniref:Deoxyribose-phosphate aldolase n=2 Tax=Streptococcus equinus TaxID=1335 RepID=A0A1H0KVD5_STREI|nr:deoxyribose-phosphate aldolase [Streptococcus equinus]